MSLSRDGAGRGRPHRPSFVGCVAFVPGGGHPSSEHHADARSDRESDCDIVQSDSERDADASAKSDADPNEGAAPRAPVIVSNCHVHPVRVLFTYQDTPATPTDLSRSNTPPLRRLPYRVSPMKPVFLSRTGSTMIQSLGSVLCEFPAARWVPPSNHAVQVGPVVHHIEPCLHAAANERRRSKNPVVG